jgi:ribosomal protein S18 acetylase RimI-like enzyme
MNIAYATQSEFDYLLTRDHHVSAEALRQKIERCEIIAVWDEGQPIGYLRFNYFWDEIPFMNLLFIEAPRRGKGYGQALVQFWEQEMQKHGFKQVLTSTMSNEAAQHFYRKLGYVDCGALLLPAEPLEIILLKPLQA